MIMYVMLLGTFVPSVTSMGSWIFKLEMFQYLATQRSCHVTMVTNVQRQDFSKWNNDKLRKWQRILIDGYLASACKKSSSIKKQKQKQKQKKTKTKNKTKQNKTKKQKNKKKNQKKNNKNKKTKQKTTKNKKHPHTQSAQF